MNPLEALSSGEGWGRAWILGVFCPGAALGVLVALKTEEVLAEPSPYFSATQVANRS